MNEAEQRLRRSEDGKFTKSGEIEQTWNVVERNYPDILNLYSGIPLSSITRRRNQVDYFSTRGSVNLITLIRERFGLGMTQLSLTQIGQPLGLSHTSIITLTEASIACISEDTGINIQHTSGRNVRLEINRIRKVAAEYKKLESILEGSEDIPPLERTVIEHFLKGEPRSIIAEGINRNLNLTPPIAPNGVSDILEKYRGRYDYFHISRLTQRSLKARRVIEESTDPNYVTAKSQITEKILLMLNQGVKKDDLLDELGIGENQYRALINEVFLELEAYPEGNGDLEEIYTDILRSARLGSKRQSPSIKSRVARQLLDPYRSYRTRLGQALSERERAILNQVASGRREIDIAQDFGIWQQLMTEVVDWLLGETQFRPRTKLLEERRQIFNNLSRDVSSPSSLPVYLLTIDGIGTVEFMERIAVGETFQETVDEIVVATGKKITRSRLFSHFKAISAYYKDLLRTSE